MEPNPFLRSAPPEAKQKKKVVVRVGMSPVESNKKIGAIRSHVYNYALARGGVEKGGDSKVVFRVDDTNKNKHGKEKALELFRFFSETLGLTFDVTPDNAQNVIGQSVYQSERQDVYAKALEGLFDQRIAFVDKDSGLVLFDIKKFIETYTDVLEVNDLLKGKLKFTLKEYLKKGQPFFPIMRSDKTALYHLATVVDDAAFGVTHVVRGQDKFPIVAFQEMVRVALGLEPKTYLHTPLLLGSEGELLSGEVAFDDFIRKGIIPQALISYLISSGYGRPDTVYSSLDEFVHGFDYKKIHKTNGKFDPKRLEGLNKKLVKKITPDAYLGSLKLYLMKSGKDDLEKQLQHDPALCDLLISLRREPQTCVKIIKDTSAPTYGSVDESLFRSKISELISELERHPKVLLSAEEHKDRSTFYEALSWIFVGNRGFPDIELLFRYLQSRRMLDERVRLAKAALEAQEFSF